MTKRQNVLEKLAWYIQKINTKVERISGGLPEILLITAYAVGHLLMALVHEPWFDEAEAWQIARCVTLKTLFGQTTHYEGHPPLWHLILMPFAKLGAPYELSLTLISLAFMAAAVGLILWKSPFPRLVRWILPFTYFLFYQYGVISRVYCVMTLEFMLLAFFYGSRNEKPERTALLMMVMCFTNAYSIVLCGGICAVWLWEIYREKRAERISGETVRMLIKDRRIHWLLLLLAAAMCCMALILPMPNTTAVQKVAGGNENSLPVRLLYTFFILPADVTVSNIYSDYVKLQLAGFTWELLLAGFLEGVVIWLLLISYARQKRTAALLLVPYGMFAAFAAAVYLYNHHIGIGLLFFLFWLWVSMEKEENRQTAQITTGKVLHSAIVLCAAAALCISVYWTAAVCVADIRYTYSTGRKEAEFIKAQGYADEKIMTAWHSYSDPVSGEIVEDVYDSPVAVTIAPYLENNVFINLGQGREDLAYLTHIYPSTEQTEQEYQYWRQAGKPDLIVGDAGAGRVYPDLKATDYEMAYRQEIRSLWKDVQYFHVSKIYVKRNKLDKGDE